MSEDLLQTLENKVQNAVEMVELLKAETAELTEENAILKETHAQWEEKLTNLIGKLEQLDAEADSPMGDHFSGDVDLKEESN